MKNIIANIKKQNFYLQKNKFDIQLALKKHKLDFMIPAFNSLFGDEGKEEKKLAEVIEAMRTEMAEREGHINIFYSPKPESFNPKNHNRPAPGEIKKFSYKQAAITGVDKKWGIFLHYIVQNKPSNYIIEMGSCSGFSGCYIASANNFQKFVTIEASTDLCEIARGHIKKFSERFVVINKLFDDAIDDFIQEGLSNIDIAYIDGHHEKLATLHYFERIKPILNPDSVVIFDDIYIGLKI